MQIYKYTIRALMEDVGMNYEPAYRLVERMRNRKLVKDFGMAKIGSKNAKVYGLMMTPHEFLEQERSGKKSAKPPAAFFSNPFNLKNAEDLRWNDLRNSI